MPTHRFTVFCISAVLCAQRVTCLPVRLGKVYFYSISAHIDNGTCGSKSTHLPAYAKVLL